MGSYKFKWDKIINYFTYSFLKIYLGGDKYSNTFLKGWLDKFSYFSSCTNLPFEIRIECYYSCQTCDGPTEFSCTSCNVENNRVFDALY